MLDNCKRIGRDSVCESACEFPDSRAAWEFPDSRAPVAADVDCGRQSVCSDCFVISRFNDSGFTVSCCSADDAKELIFEIG